MTRKKINTTYFVVIAWILIGNSCSENIDQAASMDPTSLSTNLSMVTGTVSNYTFNGSEGDAISFEKANNWIINYTHFNTNKIKAHYFGNRTLNKMLEKKGSVGIRFYYSIDDAGVDQLLGVPVDDKGNDFYLPFEIKGINSPDDVMGITPIKPFSGLETDSITFEKARKHINSFNLANPKGIIAHFFGKEILRQIMAQNNCFGIRCYYALDDQGVQQLLLMGVTGNGVNILPDKNHTAGKIDGDGIIADVSSPCPALCSRK